VRAQEKVGREKSDNKFCVHLVWSSSSAAFSSFIVLVRLLQVLKKHQENLFKVASLWTPPVYSEDAGVVAVLITSLLGHGL